MRKKTRLIALLLIIIVFISILVISYLTQQPPSKKSPNEYFSFSDISALATAVPGSNTIIRISLLYFNIIATGGAAHHVVIFSQGMVNPEDYYYDEILNGTTISVEIQFKYLVQSAKQEAGFPIDIRIYSDETSPPGNVTLSIPESNVVFG